MIVAEIKDLFNLSKDHLPGVNNTKEVSFLVKAISRCTIWEKPSMNLQ
jgi:hypothetical protein